MKVTLPYDLEHSSEWPLHVVARRVGVAWVKERERRERMERKVRKDKLNVI